MGKTRPNANDSLSLQSELDRSRVCWYLNRIHILQYLYIFLQGDINESDLSQEEELTVLKEQHALLTRLLHQQKEVSCVISCILYHY